ncbi:sodium:calcium antiporter [Candidatus Aerophobetes bacterium]|nr:sodium:calcium antiporter [Candidatus Aerophobetes bacterium]
MIFIWLKFFICALLILFVGYRLSLYADAICAKTNITRGLMGFFFLALATTLPEFVTSVSSITVVGSPNLAVGNIFGSIVANLMIIALLDLIQGKGPLLKGVEINHILPSGLCIISLGIISFFILIRFQSNIKLGIFGFGLDSLIILLIYIIGLILVFQYDKRNKKISSFGKKEERNRLAPLIIKFSLCFIAIVFLGIWLSTIGEDIAKVMSLSETLVGTSFLAVATSLPELVISISSLKFSLDMSIGNILGANFLDMMIIPVCDLFFRKGELLGYISINHLITAILGIILTAIVIVGLIYRSRKSFLKLGYDAIAMIVTLAIGGYFLILVIK